MSRQFELNIIESFALVRRDIEELQKVVEQLSVNQDRILQWIEHLRK